MDILVPRLKSSFQRTGNLSYTHTEKNPRGKIYSLEKESFSRFFHRDTNLAMELSVWLKVQ